MATESSQLSMLRRGYNSGTTNKHRCALRQRWYPFGAPYGGEVQRSEDNREQERSNTIHIKNRGLFPIATLLFCWL